MPFFPLGASVRRGLILVALCTSACDAQTILFGDAGSPITGVDAQVGSPDGSAGDGDAPVADAGRAEADAGKQHDAGMPSDDDSGMMSDDDAGMPAHDAGTPAHDAGTPEHDAGHVEHDAGTPEHDAGTPEHDAGTPEHDAGTPQHDAGTPGHDAGQPQHDAGQPQHDAGQPAMDAGQPEQDAGTPEHDAGSAPHDSGLIITPPFDAGSEADAQLPPAPRCGDHQIDSNETCDDGNTTSWDGCSVSCRVEDVRWRTLVSSPTQDQSPHVLVRGDGSVIVAVNSELLDAQAVATHTPYFAGLDENGAQLFRVEFACASSQSFSFAVDVIPGDDSLRVFGTFTGSIGLGDENNTQLTAPSGGQSAFVASYDADGKLRWSRLLHHTLTAPVVSQRHALDNGDLVLAGTFAANETLQLEPVDSLAPKAGAPAKAATHFVLRLDEQGNVLTSATLASLSAASAASVQGLVSTLERDVVLLSGAADNKFFFSGPSALASMSAPSLALAMSVGGATSWLVPYKGVFLPGNAHELSGAALAVVGQQKLNETLVLGTDGKVLMTKRGTLIGQAPDGSIMLVAGYTNGKTTVEAHPLTSPLKGLTLYAVAYNLKGEYVWAHNLAANAAFTLDTRQPAFSDDGSFVAFGPCPEVLGEGDRVQTPSADHCLAKFTSDGLLAWNVLLNGKITESYGTAVEKPILRATQNGKIWLLQDTLSNAGWAVGSAEERETDTAGQYLARFSSTGKLELVLFAGSAPLASTSDLLESPHGGVITSFTYGADALLFPGDPARTELTLGTGDLGDLTVIETRP